MIRRIDRHKLQVRACCCARKPHPRPDNLVKHAKPPYHGVFALARSARKYVQINDAHHCIAVIKEVFLDYLIVNLAQKADEIQLL